MASFDGHMPFSGSLPWLVVTVVFVLLSFGKLKFLLFFFFPSSISEDKTIIATLKSVHLNDEDSDTLYII